MIEFFNTNFMEMDALDQIAFSKAYLEFGDKLEPIYTKYNKEFSIEFIPPGLFGGM